MEHNKAAFGKRKGGYTSAEMAAYQQSQRAAFDAKKGRERPSAPISNEVQGLRGLAKVDPTREPAGSLHWLGRPLLVTSLLTMPFLVATVGPSFLECGVRDRPFDVFVDDALRACVGRGAQERLRSFQAHLLSQERGSSG
jgi:hypothetical protein